MKREGVIITSFIIDRPKQVNFFQIRIPREVEKIIGIEMGVRWTTGTLPAQIPPASWTLPMFQKRNIILGEFKLQSYERANIFYSGELVLNRNMDFADFSSEHFSPKEYTHQMQSNEDVVEINGNTTLVQGVYRDKVSDQIEGSYKYTVMLYVWGASKIDQSNL